MPDIIAAALEESPSLESLLSTPGVICVPARLESDSALLFVSLFEHALKTPQPSAFICIGQNPGSYFQLSKKCNKRLEACCKKGQVNLYEVTNSFEQIQSLTQVQPKKHSSASFIQSIKLKDILSLTQLDLPPGSVVGLDGLFLLQPYQTLALVQSFLAMGCRLILSGVESALHTVLSREDCLTVESVRVSTEINRLSWKYRCEEDSLLWRLLGGKLDVKRAGFE